MEITFDIKSDSNKRLFCILIKSKLKISKEEEYLSLTYFPLCIGFPFVL